MTWSHASYRMRGRDDVCEVSLPASPRTPRTDALPENPDHTLITSRGTGDDCTNSDELECPGGVDAWWRLHVQQ
ncbi:hypothetical protein K1Y78_28190 [Streptomyces sp. tea 10]|nr:hypothetical protein [Streptomyces sp. tea 10]